MENFFTIVIPFYNAGEFLDRCLSSALSQKYDNFKIILLNDASNEETTRIAEEISRNNDRIIYIKNEARMGAMFNHQNAVFNYCDKDDIVIQLDGDDWFSSKNTLSFIDNFYINHKCLMMYGQAMYLDGRIGNARPYNSEEDFKNKRNLPFYVSHVRTFRAKVFQEIKNQDPELKCFKNSLGEWYSMTCDVAMMYPIMEISGYDKVKYNDKVLYIYNNSNPICDYKIDLNLQESIHKEILMKSSFNQVDF